MDPSGWYRLQMPATWQEVGPGRFHGGDGFAQTGYLPNLGYLEHLRAVCEWLANITYPGQYQVGSPPAGPCLLTPQEGSQAAPMAVWENPQAPPEQRFVYLQADAAHFEALQSSFAWARPVDPHARWDWATAPPRPQDETFWRQTQPLPAHIALEEVPLPADVQPGRDVLPWPTHWPPLYPAPSPSLSEAQRLAILNHRLAFLGYRLEVQPHLYLRLYTYTYQGTPILTNLEHLPSLSVIDTPEGPRPVGSAWVVENPEEVPEEEERLSLYLLNGPQATLWSQGFLPGHTLKVVWTARGLRVMDLSAPAQIRIFDAQHRLRYTFSTPEAWALPGLVFTSWQGRWLLNVDGFLIQEGEVLNVPWKLEAIFGWHRFRGEPFFFFRKGPWVGVAYAGAFYDTRYEEVAHGLCCGYAANNPHFGPYEVRFFARRAGRWYAVRLVLGQP